MKTNSTTRRFVLEEDSFPDLPLMMLITLDTLRALGGSGTIQELVDHAIEAEGLTEEEQAYLMPYGRDRRFNYYLAWSRTYLKRGEALENSARGVWALTELGEGITTLEETQKIHAKVNEEERQRAKAKRDAKKGEKVESVPEDIAVDVFAPDEDKTNWQNILLAQLMQMAPSAFERLAQRLLREAGFVKVEVRGKTGDGGLDGVGRAGHRQHHGPADQAADRATEHRRSADLLKAEHPKQLAVAGERLRQQARNGLESLVAAADAGAAGK